MVLHGASGVQGEGRVGFAVPLPFGTGLGGPVRGIAEYVGLKPRENAIFLLAGEQGIGLVYRMPVVIYLRSNKELSRIIQESQRPGVEARRCTVHTVSSGGVATAGRERRGEEGRASQDRRGRKEWLPRLAGGAHQRVHIAKLAEQPVGDVLPLDGLHQPPVAGRPLLGRHGQRLEKGLCRALHVGWSD